jgi:hypothetical protein
MRISAASGSERRFYRETRSLPLAVLIRQPEQPLRRLLIVLVSVSAMRRAFEFAIICAEDRSKFQQ